MASVEHLELSTFIKNVHKKLREDSKTLGCEKAWIKHCNDEETLKRYAVSMKELAITHWEINQQKEDSKALSRITWVYENCLSYFRDGGLEYQRKRELDIGLKNDLDVKDKNYIKKLDKYLLLDVGSCYNPFGTFELFDVVPIDLAPANDDVLQCDFLNVQICDIHQKHITDKSKIISLTKELFHVVVFSLLLEYLPEPEQRLQCCKNAYQLLAPEGILVIITPDAKHVGANTRFMKSWRYVLATIGFCRIKYEKLPYIHCMVFRKSVNPKVAKRWAELNENKNLYDQIYIPQDFNNKSDESKVYTTIDLF